jgi:hypothetical protein
MIAILLLLIVCFLLSWYSNMPQPIQIITFVCEALAVLALVLPFGVRLFPGW